jgi:signal peptidase II
MRDAAPGWSRWLAVSVAVVVADLASKAWVSHVFSTGDVLRVTPFFNLVLTYNPGAAFSFLADAGGWQRWFFTAVALAISVALVVMLRRPHRDRLVPAALSLVLGGALGNLWDRLTLGHVVDFVQLHAAGYYWPAFNVADSAITVGVALLVWDGLRGGAAKTQSKVAP